MRASSQLAAALHIETEQPVRTEVIKAVRRMSQFIGEDEPNTVIQFIHDFADANRTARSNFVHVLAEYCALAPKVTDGHLKKIIGFAPFCSYDELTMACLKGLEESKECQDIQHTQQLLRKANNWEDVNEPSVDLLTRLELVAAQLIDANRSFAYALHALPSAQCTWFSVDNRINISCCFLPELKLENKCLDYVYGFDIHLQGACLNYTSLKSADFFNAHLEGIMLIEANLSNAKCHGAKFYRANLHKAILKEAEFWMACLTEAAFTETKLELIS